MSNFSFRSIRGGYLSEYRTEIYGVAALLIIIGHSQDFMTAIFSDAVISIIGYGGIGVAMFAFLGGMGLWHSMQRDSNVGRFYIRRIKRLLIPYLIISIPYYIIFDWIIKGNLLLCLKDITFVSYFLDGGGTWYVAWIFLMYIVYPWYYLLGEKLFKRHREVLSMIALGVMIIAEVALVSTGNESVITKYQNSFGATIAIVIGDCLAKDIKKDKKYVLWLSLACIILAPLYLFDIVSGAAVYVWFFALEGIFLCGLFSILFCLLNGGLLSRAAAVLGAASLESYMFNVYLISFARLILGNSISTMWGVVGYLVVCIVGLGFAYFVHIALNS